MGEKNASLREKAALEGEEATIVGKKATLEGEEAAVEKKKTTSQEFVTKVLNEETNYGALLIQIQNINTQLHNMESFLASKQLWLRFQVS